MKTFENSLQVFVQMNLFCVFICGTFLYLLVIYKYLNELNFVVLSMFQYKIVYT